MIAVSHTNSQTIRTVGGRIVRVARVSDQQGDTLTMKTDDGEGFVFRTSDFLRVFLDIREDWAKYA